MSNIKYVGCKINGCDGEHRSRGYCRKHYRQLIGEGKRRYQKVKNNTALLSSTKEAIKEYRKTIAYRNSKKKSDKKYYERNMKKIKEYKTEWNELQRFGIKREVILQRDNYKCTKCLTPIVGELIVHHINNKGRAVEIPDNDLSNLITLCRSCHMNVHLHDN